MYVPPDFDSETTFQYSGYFHPHERGVTYTNAEFEDIFRKQYFVPDYVKYLYPKLKNEEIKIITEKLMQDDDLVQAGVFYMRIKSILMMFDIDDDFLMNFVNQAKEKSVVLKRMKFLDVECLDNLPDQHVLEFKLERMRVISQLYIINSIRCQLEGVKCYEKLHKLTHKFVEGFKTFNSDYDKIKRSMVEWNVWAIPFLGNLGSALCGMEKLEVSTNQLYESLFKN